MVFFQESFGVEGSSDPATLLGEWTHVERGDGLKKDDAWMVSSGKWSTDGRDFALHTIRDHTQYSLHRPLQKPVRFCTHTGSEGVSEVTLQFLVKHEQRIECGGGYLKLLPPGASFDGPSFAHAVRFGSDICGTDTRDFIFELAVARVNAIGSPGEYTMYKLKAEHRQKISTDRFAHVYTVVLSDSASEVVHRGDGTTHVGTYGAEKTSCERKGPTTLATIRVELLLDDESLLSGTIQELMEPVQGAGQIGANEALHLPSLGSVGFDLWQVRGGSYFDDVLVSGVREVAEQLRAPWRWGSARRGKELALFKAHDSDEKYKLERESQRTMELRVKQEKEQAEIIRAQARGVK